VYTVRGKFITIHTHTCNSARVEESGPSGLRAYRRAHGAGGRDVEFWCSSTLKTRFAKEPDLNIGKITLEVKNRQNKVRTLTAVRLEEEGEQ
jgi:hypothetical protein